MVTKYFLIAYLSILCLLPSCAATSAATETFKSTDKTMVELRDAIKVAKDVLLEIKFALVTLKENIMALWAHADTNKDDRTTLWEVVAILLGGTTLTEGTRLLANKKGGKNARSGNKE